MDIRWKTEFIRFRVMDTCRCGVPLVVSMAIALLLPLPFINTREPSNTLDASPTLQPSPMLQLSECCTFIRGPVGIRQTCVHMGLGPLLNASSGWFPVKSIVP